jgi:hypothetical protein
MSKTTIVVLSDPNNGEEALGRLFNALAAAYDFKRQEREVRVLFQGAGTRWSAVVQRPDHPVHALYKAVEDTVVGASSACATFFGAHDDVVEAGLPLVSDNPVPGTSGLPSLARYAREGAVLTF